MSSTKTGLSNYDLRLILILTSEKRWHINNALIAKIDCMFLITDLQFAINAYTFFIVEIIDFNLKKKRLHTLIAYAFVREKSCFHNGEQKGLWLCVCNCAKCESAKRTCFYSYSAVCRHHNMYGTSTAEGQ